MTRNFVEIFTVNPVEGVVKDGHTFSSAVKAQFQEFLTILKGGPGAIVMETRKDTEDPNTLFILAGWESLADHDDLDIQGIVPKVLKKLLMVCEPQDVFYLYLDLAKVDVAANLLFVDIFRVKEGEKAAFQKEIDARPELVGAWYTIIPVPPLPKVMPTDPVELAIIEGQKLQAESNLRKFTPAIWIAFSSSATEGLINGFKYVVRGFVEEEKSSKYEKFLVA